MHDLFISYARKDQDFVRKLHAALTDSGRESWVDWNDIPPTAEWLQEIEAAIESAQVFLFVLSPLSANSAMCNREIDHAVQNHKRIIPIVIRTVEAALVPEEVAKLQWLFFKPEDDFKTAFAILLSALDTDIDWVRAHTQLQTRAIEWRAKQHDPSLLLRGNVLKQEEAWLMQAGARQPSPTPLQIEYVSASRSADTRRQRMLVGALVGGLIITSLLAIAAWQQRRNAIAQRDEAIRQHKTALSKQLAAYSELLSSQSPNLLDRASLLAVEAARHVHSPESNRALRQALAVLPVMLFDQSKRGDEIRAVAISPDGDQVTAGEVGGKIWTWRVSTGALIKKLSLGRQVSAIAYSPDGRLLAWGGPSGVGLLLLRENRQLALPARETRELSFSSDSRLLFAGGEGEVTVWSASTGQRIRSMAVRAKVDALATSPDGQLLAEGGSDNWVHVWDVQTGKEWFHGRHDNGSASMPLRLGSRDGGVFALAFYKNGKYLASGGQDHSVRVWDIASGREMFRGYQADSIYGVAFSPVAPLLASGGMDGTARVWDLAKGYERYRLQHKDTVIRVMWDPDGKLLTVSQDGTARLWDMSTGEERARLYQSGHFSAAAMTQDFRRVVTTGYDESAGTVTVRVWNATNNGEALLLPHKGAADAVFSPDGKQIVTVGDNYFAQLWKLPGGELKAKLPHSSFVGFATFSPDGKVVVTCGWDGMARVWDAKSAKMLAELRHQGRVQRAEFSPDGRLLATAGFEDGSARLWRVDSWLEARRLMHTGVEGRLQRMMGTVGGVRFLAFAPFGELATAGQDGTVRLWNTSTGEETLRLTLGGYGDKMAFTPDGKYLVTDSEKEFAVWSLPSGSKVTTLKKGSDQFMSLFGLSPNGQLALVGSQEQRAVQVRTVPSLKQIASVPHEDTIYSARFSRNGSRLVTASADTTCRLWDTRSWQEVARLKTGGSVIEARFNPDESLVATASNQEGLARVWIVRTADLISAVCHRLTRNLTPQEWHEYLGTEAYTSTCEVTSAKDISSEK